GNPIFAFDSERVNGRPIESQLRPRRRAGQTQLCRKSHRLRIVTHAVREHRFHRRHARLFWVRPLVHDATEVHLSHFSPDPPGRVAVRVEQPHRQETADEVPVRFAIRLCPYRAKVVAFLDTRGAVAGWKADNSVWPTKCRLQKIVLLTAGRAFHARTRSMIPPRASGLSRYRFLAPRRYFSSRRVDRRRDGSSNLGDRSEDLRTERRLAGPDGVSRVRGIPATGSERAFTKQRDELAALVPDIENARPRRFPGPSGSGRERVDDLQERPYPALGRIRFGRPGLEAHQKSSPNLPGIQDERNRLNGLLERGEVTVRPHLQVD